MQPCEMVGKVVRFKANEIVKHLLETHPSIGMNELASGGFSREDEVQFAQLIGYSLGGFSELEYVSDEEYSSALAMFKSGGSETDARLIHLHRLLKNLRDGLREPMAELFEKHPDDLLTVSDA